MAEISVLVLLIAVALAAADTAVTPAGSQTSTVTCNSCCGEPLRNIGDCAGVPPMFDEEIVKKCGGGPNFSALVKSAETEEKRKNAASVNKAAGDTKAAAAAGSAKKSDNKPTKTKNTIKTLGATKTTTKAVKTAGKPNKKLAKVVDATKKKEDPAKRRGKRDAGPDDPCVWDEIFKELDLYEDDNEFDEELLYNITSENVAKTWEDPLLHAVMDCAELAQSDILKNNRTETRCDYRAFFFISCFHSTLVLTSPNLKDSDDCKKKIEAVSNCEPTALEDPPPAIWESDTLTKEEMDQIEMEAKREAAKSNEGETGGKGKGGGKGKDGSKGKGKDGSKGKGKDGSKGKGKDGSKGKGKDGSKGKGKDGRKGKGKDGRKGKGKDGSKV